jgi:hypothetical protein
MRASLQPPKNVNIWTPGNDFDVKETTVWLWYCRLRRTIKKVYDHHKCGRVHLENHNHCFAAQHIASLACQAVGQSVKCRRGSPVRP